MLAAKAAPPWSWAVAQQADVAALPYVHGRIHRQRSGEAGRKTAGHRGAARGGHEQAGARVARAVGLLERVGEAARRSSSCVW